MDDFSHTGLGGGGYSGRDVIFQGGQATLEDPDGLGVRLRLFGRALRMGIPCVSVGH